jgi:enoyl-CoA hydratase/carnithine racemase
MSSRSGKSTLPRLHLFNWALKSTERIHRLLEAAKAKALNMTAWGFDPALAIAIRFAVAEDLVEPTSTGYQITEKGRSFIAEVLKDASAFAPERKLLAQIGKDITEGMVETVAKGWESA